MQVQFTYGRVPQSLSEIRGYMIDEVLNNQNISKHLFVFYSDFILLFFWLRLVCEDITGGQENIPIPATNLVDDPPVAPTGKLNY